MAKELPIQVQAVACAALWIAWAAALKYVLWKEHTYFLENNTIVNRFTVFLILQVLIPFSANVAGLLALWRFRNRKDRSRGERWSYWVIACLTICGLVLLGLGCLGEWILLPWKQVRE